MRTLVPCSALFLLLFAGCQTYRADAPDLVAHQASWSERTPNSQAVAEYADSLRALAGGERTVFDLSDGVHLEEAEAIALLLNPELRIARLEARVPQLSAQLAGLAPDPTLNVGLLHILESVTSQWLPSVGLSFTIPLAGRLGAEQAEAFAEAGAARAAAHASERQVVMRLREAWNRWTAMGERLGLLEEHLTAIEGILAIAKAQRDARQIGAPQLRVLELEQVRRLGERDLLQIQRERAGLALNKLMGLTPDADLAFVPAFAPEREVLERPVERARIREMNPELAFAKARYEAAEKTFDLEIRKQAGNLSVGPAYQDEEGQGRLGATGGVTLPLWNRNRQAIAESRAARDAAKGAYEARFEMLVGQVADARVDQRAAVMRGVWLRERVAPMADTQLRELQKLGELGDMDVLILKDALTGVLDTKFQILDVRLQQAQASARIHALIDPLLTPLVASGSQGETR